MARTTTLVTSALLALVAAGATTFVVGMRTKWPPLQDRIRRMNKRVMNPRQLASGAGGPGSWASVVHHVGRTSGRPYATPVVPVPTDDGFWVSLPYGPGADWVRNVLAAGGATIEHQGETIHVDRPEVTAAEPGEDRMADLFGVTEVLRLRHADTTTTRVDGGRDGIDPAHGPGAPATGTA